MDQDDGDETQTQNSQSTDTDRDVTRRHHQDYTFTNDPNFFTGQHIFYGTTQFMGNAILEVVHFYLPDNNGNLIRFNRNALITGNATIRAPAIFERDLVYEGNALDITAQMLFKSRVDIRSGTAFIRRDATFEAVASFTPPIEFYGRKIEFKADAVFQHLA
jgi:hypothetical protein